MKQNQYATMILGITIILVDILLFAKTRWFKPAIVLGLLIFFSSYLINFFHENKRQREIEVKFLEFSRNLVEKVRTGIPIPKAILQIADIDFGALNPYVKKLAYHIEWGIPLREAFTTFAKDTKNPIIKRSISIVIEAEQSGGNITDVLQAVTDSILQIKKIKDERRSNTYTQTVQGYFIFFIFIGIMLILQIYLIPQLGNITSTVLTGLGTTFESLAKTPKTTSSILDINSIFTWLVVIQGFFTGIMIGKFAEGELKMGIKHSLILMVLGYVIISLFAK